MSDMNELFTVELGGAPQQVSLLDLAGLNMDQIAEVRGFPVPPEGVAEWKITGGEVGTGEFNDKAAGGKVKRPYVQFICTAQAYRTVKDPSLNPADLVGIEHRERFIIKDVLKDLGRAKSFMVDVGQTGSGTLEQLVHNCVGLEFVAAMKHTADQNDKDRKFANFVQSSIEPNTGAAIPGMAPAGANQMPPANVGVQVAQQPVQQPAIGGIMLGGTR